MKIWDLGTRLYHWIQAAVFIGLISTGFLETGPHIKLGLVLFTLIIWRILWGFFGSETNRFKQFVHSPRAIVRYLLGQPYKKAGHNPAGGFMVIILISLLLLQCISGLALAGLLDHLPMAERWLTDDLFSLLASLHWLLARALPLLICLHVIAIIFYKINNKPLVWAMFSGFQIQNKGMKTPYFVSNHRAFLMLVLAAFVTMAIIASSTV